MAEKMEATPVMAKVGVNWLDIKGWAEHLIHLLQTEGETAIDLVDTGVRLIQGITGKDYVAIFAALQAGQKDIQEIVAAVKAEFDL